MVKLENDYEKINVFIFHHIDNDGYAAGFWCREDVITNLITTYESDNWGCYNDISHIVYNINLIPINYNQPVDYSNIKENDIVYVVDFSFEPEVMDEIYNITKNVIWIDHHLSAINKYSSYESKYQDSSLLTIIPGCRSTLVAGCALTWQYLFGSMRKEDEDILYILPDTTREEIYENSPIANRYIADNDIWAFELADTKKFIAGLGFININTEEGLDKASVLLGNADKYVDVEIEETIKRGTIILEYKQKELYPRMMSSAKNVRLIPKDDNTEISELSCLAINTSPCFNSDVAGDEIKNYDIFIKYSINPYGFSYTFYSTNNSKKSALYVAEYYGGGGHPGAAGARSDNLIFEFISDEI